MNGQEQSTRSRLLVVDDQTGIVSFLREFFIHKDYEVLQASTGEEALKTIATAMPAVVLLDIRLTRDLDGMQVLKKIKEVSPRTSVIMMTAVDEEETMKEAFRMGADDYIVKPFSLSYLHKVVMSKMLKLEGKRLADAS